MKSAGITIDRIEIRDGVSSGIAFIMVDTQGQNLISFVPGANGKIDNSFIDGVLAVVQEADALLCQLECPVATIEYAIEMFSSRKIPVLLNPASALPISEDILRRCAVVMPNETEAEIMTGVKVDDEKNAREACEVLQKKGCPDIIITLGERGAYYRGTQSDGVLIPAPRVHSIDAVAAGDVFAGAFAVRYIAEKDFARAVVFANNAAALSTTRKGAQPSVPNIGEVERLMTRSTNYR